MVLDRNGNQWQSGGRRDQLGNLAGGQMNMSMQDKVVGNTREDIEHKQYLASIQAAQFTNFPRFMELNDVNIPLYKFDELEDLGKKTLKQRCLDLRDLVDSTGCRFFESHQHLKLNAAQGEDVLLEWYINVQVTLAAALGQPELDHVAFGAPAGMGDSLPAPAVHNKQRQQQPQQQQQYQQQQYQQQRYQQQQYQQRQQPPAHQGYDNDFEDHLLGRSHTPRGVPQHGGFALAPPHLQGGSPSQDGEASRFDDAARIRERNNPTSRPF